MNANRLRLLTLFAILLFLPMLGCDGCSNDAKIPAKPIDRVKDISEKLPKNTEIAFFLADLKESRAALNNIKARVPDAA